MLENGLQSVLRVNIFVINTEKLSKLLLLLIKDSSKGICNVKAGVHLNGIFALLNTGLVQISRWHFKQSKNSMLKT